MQNNIRTVESVQENTVKIPHVGRRLSWLKRDMNRVWFKPPCFHVALRSGASTRSTAIDRGDSPRLQPMPSALDLCYFPSGASVGRLDRVDCDRSRRSAMSESPWESRPAPDRLKPGLQRMPSALDLCYPHLNQVGILTSQHSVQRARLVVISGQTWRSAPTQISGPTMVVPPRRFSTAARPDPWATRVFGFLLDIGSDHGILNKCLAATPSHFWVLGIRGRRLMSAMGVPNGPWSPRERRGEMRQPARILPFVASYL
jgi:hypothetical protein